MAEVRHHHEEAVRIARTIAERTVLLEALLARGRAAARRGDAETPRADLQEALVYAVAGPYRLYEADCRVGLAWAHHQAGDDRTARAEADEAIRLSVELDYHWGREDGIALLELMAASGPTQEAPHGQLDLRSMLQEPGLFKKLDEFKRKPMERGQGG